MEAAVNAARGEGGNPTGNAAGQCAPPQESRCPQPQCSALRMEPETRSIVSGTSSASTWAPPSPASLSGATASRRCQPHRGPTHPAEPPRARAAHAARRRAAAGAGQQRGRAHDALLGGFHGGQSAPGWRAGREPGAVPFRAAVSTTRAACGACACGALCTRVSWRCHG